MINWFVATGKMRTFFSPLSKSVSLPARQANSENISFNEQWLEKIDHALMGVQFYMEKGVLNDAALLRHQATERAYACVLPHLDVLFPVKPRGRLCRMGFLRAYRLIPCGTRSPWNSSRRASTFR
jgi:hypothetical protein